MNVRPTVHLRALNPQALVVSFATVLGGRLVGVMAVVIVSSLTLAGSTLRAQSLFLTPYAITTLAGQCPYGSADGPGSVARFRDPGGVAVDGAGIIYVADANNNTIRMISPTGVVMTLAGSAGQAGSADGTGNAARFNGPEGVAVDGAGNVYVADTNNQLIRKISPAGVVTTLAGSPGQNGTADGTGSAARFYLPYAVAVDGGGNIYVADYGNNTIRKISPAGVVTTLAGSAGQSGSVDGTGSSALFNGPNGVAVDSGGNVYVADTHGCPVKGHPKFC